MAFSFFINNLFAIIVIFLRVIIVLFPKAFFIYVLFITNLFASLLNVITMSSLESFLAVIALSPLIVILIAYIIINALLFLILSFCIKLLIITFLILRISIITLSYYPLLLLLLNNEAVTLIYKRIGFD